MDPSQDILEWPACGDRFDVSGDGCSHFGHCYGFFSQGDKRKDFGIKVSVGVYVEMPD